MLIRVITCASVLGWLVGVALLVSLTTGLDGHLGAKLNFAEARASESRLTEEAAMAVASQWATGYVDQTLGREHEVAGRPLTLDDMHLVQATFVPDARELVTSATSAVALPTEQNVWIFAWELDGLPNVTTGRSDGTAHIVLVLGDESGGIKDAVAGIRQPEDQARQVAGLLPTFDDILGNTIRGFAAERSRCRPNEGSRSGAVTPLTC